MSSLSSVLCCSLPCNWPFFLTFGLIIIYLASRLENKPETSLISPKHTLNEFCCNTYCSVDSLVSMYIM
jgi:hypothetical protein